MNMQKNELVNRKGEKKLNPLRKSVDSKGVKNIKTIHEIEEILDSVKDLLKEKYTVKSLAIFGSFARGEQKEESDIDILVEFNKPIGLAFIELGDFLSEVLGVKVDLVTAEMVRKNPLLKENVERDLHYV
jgi:hypothetical protein